MWQSLKKSGLIFHHSPKAFNLLQKLYGTNDVSIQKYEDKIIKRLTNYYKENTLILAARNKFNKTLMKPGQAYASW